MKRTALLLLAAFSVAAAVAAVSTRAIFTADSPPLEAIEARTATVSVSLDFATDPSVKGVPGEAIPLTSANSVATDTASGVAFRITYSASGNTGIIKSLYLSDETGLLKPAEQNDPAKLIYYGVINEKAVRDLGSLIAEFSAAAEESVSNDNFVVSAEILACQIDEEAIKQAFGLNKTEIAALLD